MHIISNMINTIIPTVIGVMFTNIASLSWASPQVLDSALIHPTKGPTFSYRAVRRASSAW